MRLHFLRRDKTSRLSAKLRSHLSSLTLILQALAIAALPQPLIGLAEVNILNIFGDDNVNCIPSELPSKS
jgi:hypothetical protein